MINLLVGGSIAVYFIFYLWDKKQIKDEREQLIELKASDLQSKVTLMALVGLALYYWLNPYMPVWFCLIVINIANLYSEIAGKLYWRMKL